MKKSKYSDSKIITILKQTEVDTPIPESYREHGMSLATILSMKVEVWEDYRLPLLK